MNNLPNENIISIINYLLPYEILIAYKDPIQIDFEFDENNYKIIYHSNKNIINLAKTCKILKKYSYEYGLLTIYFPNQININNILLFKSKRIIAPNDQTLCNDDLIKINKINTIIASSNTMLDHINYILPNITKFETGWIPLINNISFTDIVHNKLNYFNMPFNHFDYIAGSSIKKYSRYTRIDYAKLDSNFYRPELFINKFNKKDYIYVVKVNSNLISDKIIKSPPIFGLSLLPNYDFFLNLLRNHMYFNGSNSFTACDKRIITYYTSFELVFSFKNNKLNKKYKL